MTLAYDNFDLLITADDHVRAESSTEGDAGPERIELDDNAVALALELLKHGAAPATLQQQLGATLFRALFPPPILALFERTRGRAPEQRVRLRLRIESPRLAALPWEFAFDGERVLGLSTDTVMVRAPANAPVAPSLRVEGALRVLVAIADPSNYPDLNRAAYVEALKAVFSELQTSGAIEVEFLPRATCAGLIRRLRSGTFHVLHLLGYTALDAETRQAALLLEEENGLARRMSGADLASLLRREDLNRAMGEPWALRLVIINECRASTGAFSSYALQLALDIADAGVPALIAMQYPLSLDNTAAFTAECYGALTRGLPLDAAVALGRAGIAGFRAQSSSTPAETAADQPAATAPVAPATATAEWAAPALVCRIDDSQLIEPRQAEIARFNTSLETVYARIDAFEVVTSDRITRFFLAHLRMIAIIAALGLIIHGLGARRFDPLLISAVAVALWCIHLLRDLFVNRLPETLRTLWTRRLIMTRGDGEPLEGYLAFLEEYNALLNHPRWIRIPQAIGVAVALVTLSMLNLRDIPGPLLLPLWTIIAVLAPLAGYVFGTLLWKMCATMVATRRLSYHFNLDVRPTHPDGCGGLKPLGDLYFAQARIVLIAGLFFAAWVSILTVSHAALARHVSEVSPQQAALVADYPSLCAAGNAPADDIVLLPRACEQLAEAARDWAAPSMSALPRYLALRAVFVAVTPEPWPAHLALVYALHYYYRWLQLYQTLLVIMALIAIVTFVLPMYKAHQIMHDLRPRFRRRADSIAGEITELEHYIERYGAGDNDEERTIVARLDWLNDRYTHYTYPPLWPFDVAVERRFLASLGSMALSFGLAELLPALAPLVSRTFR